MPKFDFPSYCLGDLSWVDIQEYLREKDTVLVPVASLEQHGRHLPLSTDTITALEVSRRAAEQAEVLYTPVMWAGYSPQHLGHVGEGLGTITLRASTFQAVCHDIARSLIHHGFNRLIFVAGHGSNVKVIDPVLRKLKYETGAFVGYYKAYAERYMGFLKGLLENPEAETPGWHGSELETSQVLAHDARLVRMDRAIRERPRTPEWLGAARGAREGARRPGTPPRGGFVPLDPRHEPLVGDGERIEDDAEGPIGENRLRHARDGTRPEREIERDHAEVQGQVQLVPELDSQIQIAERPIDRPVVAHVPSEGPVDELPVEDLDRHPRELRERLRQMPGEAPERLVALLPGRRERVADAAARGELSVVHREDEVLVALELDVRRVRQAGRSEEHTSELQSLAYLVCRLLLEKKIC